LSNETILETEDLTKEFSGFVAVNGVGLRVARGTIHALIGPNGAGKTTCFNLLTKFLSPSRGRIVFKGRDITALPPAEVARLGLVRSFQISAVFPHLTVLENVRIALQRRRGGSFDFWRSKRVLDALNDRALALITDVGLAQFAHATAAELPPGYPYGLRFAVPQAEMPVYLPWLMRQVRDLGGEIVTRRVTALSELFEAGVDALVNCPGLGARELVGDRSVYPVRGQIVRVTNPGITMSVRDEFHPDGRAYVHPRSGDCVLGGTLDEDEWDTKPDPGTAEAIIARCTEIVPALADAKVIEHLAGLRPGRPEVRLESNAPAGGGPRIVHNYGHGGAGITLSWGCAEQATRILRAGET